MTATVADRRSPSRSGSWSVLTSEPADIAISQRSALGTSARVVVWPAIALPRALDAVDTELDLLDRQASRFRDDSELVRAERHRGPVLLSPGLAEAVAVALDAAAVTDGMVDPTIGAALRGLGYDRDFAAIAADDAAPVSVRPVAGWRSVHLVGRTLRLPPGVHLDLGATAKGLGADRAAAAAIRAVGRRGGVLVSLGGDIAVAGTPPEGGWPVAVGEDPTPDAGAPIVRLERGGLATSSVLHRRWKREGRTMHHIVDPATGLPAAGPWRTVTVAAPSCVEANAASTAAIVAGAAAVGWLSTVGLPARLVSWRGSVVGIGGWPPNDQAPLALEPGGPRWSRFRRGAPA